MCTCFILGVLEYFDLNWHGIQEQWVKCHLLKHHCLSNTTNNRLESLNQKLKSVIAKYSTLPTFFSTLMNCVDALRIEKDIKTAEQIMKVSTKIFTYKPHEFAYKKVLTPFAFDHVKKESDLMDGIVFSDIDAQFAVCGRGFERIITRPNSCDCETFTSMGLICKHILAFRKINNMELFDASICLDRWKLTNYETFKDESVVFAGNISCVQTNSQPRNRLAPKNPAEKFQAIKMKCNKLCALMSELPINLFTTATKHLDDFIKNINGELTFDTI